MNMIEFAEQALFGYQTWLEQRADTGRFIGSGMYPCDKCRSYHYPTSNIGRKHQKFEADLRPEHGCVS